MALTHQSPFATVSGHLLNTKLFYRITVSDAFGRVVDDVAGATGRYALSLLPGASTLKFTAPNFTPAVRKVVPHPHQALHLDVALTPAASVFVRLRTKGSRSPEGARLTLTYGDGTSVSAIAPASGELVLRDQPTGIPVTFRVEGTGARVISATRLHGFARGLNAADFVIPFFQQS